MGRRKKVTSKNERRKTTRSSDYSTRSPAVIDDYVRLPKVIGNDTLRVTRQEDSDALDVIRAYDSSTRYSEKGEKSSLLSRLVILLLL